MFENFTTTPNLSLFKVKPANLTSLRFGGFVAFTKGNEDKARDIFERVASASAVRDTAKIRATRKDGDEITAHVYTRGTESAWVGQDFNNPVTLTILGRTMGEGYPEVELIAHPQEIKETFIDFETPVRSKTYLKDGEVPLGIATKNDNDIVELVRQMGLPDGYAYAVLLCCAERGGFIQLPGQILNKERFVRTAPINIVKAVLKETDPVENPQEFIQALIDKMQ